MDSDLENGRVSKRGRRGSPWTRRGGLGAATNLALSDRGRGGCGYDRPVSRHSNVVHWWCPGIDARWRLDATGVAAALRVALLSRCPISVARRGVAAATDRDRVFGACLRGCHALRDAAAQRHRNGKQQHDASSSQFCRQAKHDPPVYDRPVSDASTCSRIRVLHGVSGAP